MKKTIIALIFLFMYAGAFAQLNKNITVVNIPDSSAKKPVVTKPSYPGNIGEYLMSKVKINRPLKGSETIRFLVNTDGTLSQFNVINSLGSDVDSAMIKALREMPEWKPATEDGKPVPMRYNLPIGMG